MQPIGELPLIAGHLALDFVNTAEERGHPDAGEALHTPADLRLWGERQGLLARCAPDEGDGAELKRAVDTRELLYGLFLAHVRGNKPSPTELARLAELASLAYHAAALQQHSDGALGWTWDPSRLSTVRHTVLIAAVELLSAAPSARLKQCPGEHCGWFFLDGTKRGNRRWCSMSECGQDAKTARRRAQPAPYGHASRS